MFFSVSTSFTQSFLILNPWSHMRKLPLQLRKEVYSVKMFSLSLFINPFIADLEELDVVIAVHVSHNTKIKDIKKNLAPFMEDIVSSMDIDSGAVRASVVVFGTDSTVQFDLKKIKKSKKLLKAVKKALKPTSVRTKGSDIVKVLNTIQTNVFVKKSGDRDNVPNLLVLLTDSASPSQITDIIQESAAMKRSGTTIFSVGIQDADNKEIESLASDPASDFSFVGKSYSDYTTSADLRRKLSNIKICK